MSKNFSIKSIKVSAEQSEHVREFKFKFIDYTNSLGVYYVANGFVSFCLNRMLKHFNEPEDLVFETGDCEARQCDLETFRTQGAVFLSILKHNLSDDAIFEHVQDVFTRTIDTLEELTAEARLAREEAAKVEQV